MTAVIILRQMLRFDQSKQMRVFSIIGRYTRICYCMGRVKDARCREDRVGNGLPPLKHGDCHAEMPGRRCKVNRRVKRERRLEERAVMEVLACTKTIKSVHDGDLIVWLNLDKMVQIIGMAHVFLLEGDQRLKSMPKILSTKTMYVYVMVSILKG